MTRGVFVVFEGVEGSGKSTQAVRLAAWLEGRSIPHIVTREPGGTPIGEETRRLLLDVEEPLPARTELLLILAARAALVEDVIRPALAEGRVVIADRFELSTKAYQGYGRGLPLDDIVRLNAFATAELQPDLTILLEVPLETGEARREAAGRSPDRIEREGRAFHARVSEAYGLLARTDSAVVPIDGTGEPAEIAAAVMKRLRDRFPETFGAAAG